MNIAEMLKDLGVEVSDDFVGKLTASIETTVAQRVQEEVEKVSAQAEEYGEYCKGEIQKIQEKAESYAEYVVEEMTQKVEDYAEYVVEQFVQENEKRLVETEEYNRMAATLRTIRGAFETNYFTLTDEPANQKLTEELDVAKKQFNELFEEHRTLKRQIADYSKYVDGENRKSIFESLTTDLADTQIEKLTKLIESASFETIEAYRAGVELMVQELLTATKEPAPVTESKEPEKKEEKPETTLIPEEDNSDRMASYLSVIK